MDKNKIDKLLTSIQKGDENAFEQFYILTQKDIYLFLLSITKNEETAKDLMQDTYIKIRKNAYKYRPGTNGRAWVLTLSKNLAMNYFKKQNRTNYIDDKEYNNVFNQTTNPYNQIDDNITLKKTLKILKKQERQIIILHTMGYKHREIAKILKTPIGTVLWRYQKGLKKMKEKLEGNYEK